MEPITLGEKYRDTITGFEGVATARTEFQFGCVRVCLEGSKLKDDGSPLDAWFDEQRLVTVEGAYPLATARAGGPGGPVPSRRTTG